MELTRFFLWYLEGFFMKDRYCSSTNQITQVGSNYYIDILISRSFPLFVITMKHGVTRPVVYCINPTVHSQYSMLLLPAHRPLAQAPIRRLIHRCTETKVLHTLFTYEDLCPQTTSRPQDLEHTAQKRYYDNNLYRYRNNHHNTLVIILL